MVLGEVIFGVKDALFQLVVFCLMIKSSSRKLQFRPGASKTHFVGLVLSADHLWWLAEN